MDKPTANAMLEAINLFESVVTSKASGISARSEARQLLLKAIESQCEAMAAWGAAQEREKVAKEIDKLECELGESDSAFQNECIKNTRLREQLRIVAGFVGDPIKEIPKDTMSALDSALTKLSAHQGD